jgi:hypothetical protein
MYHGKTHSRNTPGREAATAQDALIAGVGVDFGNKRYRFETTGQNHSLTRKT